MARTNLMIHPENSGMAKWLLMLLFCTVAALLVFGGYWFYLQESDAIKSDEYNNLKAIADLKINQIVSWRQERFSDARLNSASPILRDSISRLNAAPENPSLKDEIFSYLMLIRNLRGYENVILASPDGRVLISLDPRLTVLEAKTKELVALAVSSYDAVFGDFFRCPVCGQIHLDVAAPLVDEENQPLAVLILRTNPETFLYPLIQSWPLPSNSAETLLVRREGDEVVFLNKLRHRNDPPLSLKIPVSQADLPAAQAVLGKTGLFEGKDYRGVEVLADIRHVPGSGWFMVAKVDKDEIFAGVRQRAYLIGFLTLALVFFSGAGIAFIYKHQGKRTFEALYLAERERAEAKEEFKTTLYSIGDAVITTDVKGFIRQMNPVAEQLTGWKEVEVKGKPAEEIFKIVNEATGEKAENPVQKVLTQGMVVGLVNHALLIAKGGAEIPIADSGSPIRDEDGDITGVVLVFRDQTKEREIEKLVLARLKLLEYAAAHSLAELLQKTLDEVGALTKSPIGFYHFVEEDQETLSLQAWSTRTLTEFCKAKGKGLHYSIHQAGVWVDCVYAGKPVIHNDYKSLPYKKGMPEGHAAVIRELVVPIMRSDRVVAILGVGNKPTDYTEKDIEIVSYLADVAWEIAERKRAEDKIRENEKRFRSLFENMLNGFAYCKMLFDDNGRPKDFIFLDVNDAFEKLTGLKNVTGRKVTEVIPGIREADPGLFEIYGRVASTGQPERFEMKVAALDAWFSISVYSPAKDHFVAVFDVITERKQSEAKLRESEGRFRLLYEQSPVAYQSLDAKGNILDVNATWLKELGYSREEVIGKWFGDFLAGDGPDLLPEYFEALKVEGEAHGVEFEMKRKDGISIHVSFEARVSTDLAGAFSRTHCVFVNITERKSAEEILRKTEEKYRVIAENMADVISILDMDLRFTYVSPSIKQLRGYTVEEALAQTVDQIMTPDSLQLVSKVFEEELLLEATATADPNRSRIMELEEYKKDGSVAWVENTLSFIRDKEQKPMGILAVARDISERKLTEQKLKESEEKYRLLAETARDIILVHDMQGMIRYVNQAGLRLSGYSEAEGLKKNIVEFLPPEHLAEMAARQKQRVSGDYGVKLYETEFLNRKGQKIPVEVNSTPILLDQKIAGILIIARDITDRKTLEDQLFQAQKMESVGRLAGGVAHDFNNMLGVIIGHAEMAMEQVAPGKTVYSDLEEILKAANRSANLTRQLLAFARRQTVSPVVLDLNDTISGMLKMLRRLIGEDIDLVWKPGPDLRTVKIDPVQIDQILANLLVNARDAIAGVGDVTIETDNVVFDETYCESHAGFVCGRFVMMAVTDSGIGMDKDGLEHIFEPFYTTKEVGKGTGLGLATVYGIVKQNNGFINVYSELGKGTSFKIYLPEAVDAGETIKEESSRKNLNGSETVLLVEDEEAILKLGKSILHRHGYTVLAAYSPYEALSLARSYQGPIHLLLTDVVMPEMNGKELKEVLVHLYPEIKCLYMSGYTANAIAHHGVLDEGVNFLQKPFSVKTLTEKVRDVLEEE